MIKTHGSREVYANRWMKLREDDVEFPDGQKGIYGVVVKPNFVAIIPIDAEGRIHLVQQYRYPIAERSWEIPQGAWETNPDADPKEIAMGELREETGLRAGTMTCIGNLYQAPGFSTQGYHLYVATNLQQGAHEREATESDMIARSFSGPEVRRMVARGEIKDATTIAAFGQMLLTGTFGDLFEETAQD